MARTPDPDSLIPPIGRRGRPGSLWNAAVPFAILLVAIWYVPYASQRATVKAALASEEARHRLLVNQIALRLQGDAGHLVECVSRLGTILADVPLDDPRARVEIEATWEMLHSYQDVDVFLVSDRDGRVVASHQGSHDPESEAEKRFLLERRDRVLREFRAFGSEMWATRTRGLHLAIDGAIPAAGGEPRGAISVAVGVDRMIDRLFHGTGAEAGVTFTVMSADGSVLLHSGLAQMGPAADGATPASCSSCHGDDPIRDRVREGKPGSGRYRIEGTERVVAHAPVRVAGQVWSISASTPSSEVLRPVAQQAIVSYFFTLAVVVMVLLLGVLLRRGHIRQIRLEHEVAAQRRSLAAAREKERLDRELEAARRMAAVGEMVARVAHEVKNPLQYIGTAVDLLGSIHKDPAAGELIADMRTGVRTLNAIVTELLDFSRPMRLDLAPVQLNDLATEVAGRVIPAGVETRLDVRQGLPEVRADAFKVRQVIENIVRNAVDALPTQGAGPRAITITTANVDAGRLAGGVEVRIADTGKGIRAEDLPRIWEPFFTSKTHGSGLGLAVVRRIIDAHHGEVAVESVEGRGTTFKVTLPP
jgi:signal transduction histidine kinase